MYVFDSGQIGPVSKEILNSKHLQYRKFTVIPTWTLKSNFLEVDIFYCSLRSFPVCLVQILHELTVCIFTFTIPVLLSYAHRFVLLKTIFCFIISCSCFKLPCIECVCVWWISLPSFFTYFMSIEEQLREHIHIQSRLLSGFIGYLCSGI